MKLKVVIGLLLLLSSIFLVGCYESEKCSIDYTYHDEEEDIFIKLKAYNVEDCQPYKHMDQTKGANYEK